MTQVVFETYIEDKKEIRRRLKKAFPDVDGIQIFEWG
jgi:hypothetical protein